jgi:hypothetical protein
MIISSVNPADLPQRQGRAPNVYPGTPQHQTEQIPEMDGWKAMRSLVIDWQGADKGHSPRAAPGTIGLFVPEGGRRSGSKEAFLIDNEFARHDADSDGGLHMVVPPDRHAAATAKLRMHFSASPRG